MCISDVLVCLKCSVHCTVKYVLTGRQETAGTRRKANVLKESLQDRRESQLERQRQRTGRRGARAAARPRSRPTAPTRTSARSARDTRSLCPACARTAARRRRNPPGSAARHPTRSEQYCRSRTVEYSTVQYACCIMARRQHSS